MNQYLRKISLFLQQDESLSAEEKASLNKAVADADKELEITAFKLDRTEKVKRNTAILLEETIEELEQKRKAVEAQNRELEIEASLERVRTVAMGMQNHGEMVDVCLIISEQLELLKVKDIRNVQTAVINESKGTYINYEYYTRHDKHLTSEVSYKTHHLQEEFAFRMLKGAGEFFQTSLIGPQVKDWYEYQKTTNQFADSFLDEAQTLNYYMFSLGPVALGLSTYSPLNEEGINLFKRFRNVFELAYRRFTDIQKAEAQARGAQIELALERVRARTMSMQKSEELADVALVLFQQIKQLGIETWTIGFNIWLEGNTSYIDWVVSTDEGRFLTPYTVDLTVHPFFMEISKARKRGDDFFVIGAEGETLAEHYRLLFEMAKIQFEDLLNAGFQVPEHQINHYVFGQQVSLMFITFEPCPEAHDIFKRLGKVFEQTYTRFLDLQKAEAQAREAKIEAALERVRSRSLAMHTTSELGEVVKVIVDKLTDLGVVLDANGVILCTYFKDSKDVLHWIVSPDFSFAGSYQLPYFDHPIFNDAWKSKESGELFFSKAYSIEEKNNFFEYAFEHSDYRHFPDDFKQWVFQNDKYILSCAWQKNSAILIPSHTGLVPSADDVAILKRFAKVFEQAYIRFLDLKKAEAQAREAQIEASLERVRSKTMAMHNSQDVGDTVDTMFDELVKLGIKTNRCGILIFGNTMFAEVWTAKSNPEGKATLIIGQLDLSVHPLLTGIHQSWKEKDEVFTYPMLGDDLVEYYQAINKTKYYPTHFNIEDLPSREFHNDFYFTEGSIFAFTAEPMVREAAIIFKRFAGVFGQTYRRYLDLLKAEAQAREAQIEAALERVRSNAMAMRTSDELNIIIGKVFTECLKLDIQLDRGMIMIFDPESLDSRWWMANPEAPDLPRNYHVPYNAYKPYLEYLNGWKEQIVRWTYVLEGKAKKNWDAHIFVNSELSLLPNEVKQVMMGFTKVYLNASFNNFGGLTLASLDPMSDEHFDILLRFAKVFDLTYTRFNDLKQAEAQAREAQIEAALEKVRGKAMAMHNSNDLSATASLVFTELRRLGISPLRCGVGLLVKENRKAQLYSATSSTSGDSLSLVGWVELSGHTVLQNIYNSWLKNEDYFPELTGEQLKLYYEKLLSGLSLPVVPDWTKGQKQFGNFLSFSVGCLYAWSDIPYSDSELKILKRFASIIDLTFRRYIELQKAETQAREAIKASSLDRVRAEIASMRSVGDLQRITPLIWHELIALGVPFIRCGVFIMNEETAHVQAFLSAPDGHSLAALDLSFESSDLIRNLVNSWRKGLIFKTHWNKEEFLNWMHSMVREGQVVNSETYQGAAKPPESLDMHFVPFAQGKLYVGNIRPLTKDELDLVKSLAEAFSIAYARYEDFKKLEIAKGSIETTLSELKAAQSQLVQSEKMASLGELTAGIAHEIQNPLNFVNNFSEVSTELVDEMNDEIDKGNLGLAKEIASDLRQNLEKINHHGKRAGDIVKGMLQHSRNNSGTKEPTNINTLADEYLRLAYHGLRAKDKSFNATMKTDFDESIGNINIVPQDIGRVILNLISNAFYAVNEKKLQLSKDRSGFQNLTGLSGYEPTVSIRTKRINGDIEIRVADNGSGIPQKVLDKIFQPFFTTKPTGQGTGLGLSMSYDIVKAHGGELKVETKEGEGSEFTITLNT